MNRIAVSAVMIPIAFFALLMWTRGPANPPEVLSTKPVTSANLSSTAKPSTVGASTIDGIARVIDGDTIDVSGTRIRLEGIDAPEGAQKCLRDSGPYSCGRDATDALSNYASGKAVRCFPAGKDQFQRVLATCFLAASGSDLGAWMVSHGYAFAFIRYSQRYTAEQKMAADSKLGFWAGSFEYPWDYRARLRSGAADE